MVMGRRDDQRDVRDEDVLAESIQNPNAFAALVDTYGDVIYRYLARRVGTVEAEDLAAETLLRAFRARHGYRPDNPTALPWLYGIATNLLRDHAAAERRRLDLLTRMVDTASIDGGAEGVDDAVAAAALLPTVARAITELPGDVRDLVVLIAVEGLSYEETAHALGIPVGTVRSRLSRTRIQLRRSLGPGAPLALVGDSCEPHQQKGCSHG